MQSIQLHVINPIIYIYIGLSYMNISINPVYQLCQLLSRPPAQTNQFGGFVGLQPPFETFQPIDWKGPVECS